MILYVCNIPWKCREEELKQLFELYGEVKKASIIRDKETLRSRGFGFVTMGTQEDAREAMDRLNGHELQGRTLIVKEAHDKRKH